MRTKTLVLVLGLTVLAVAASTTLVLAHRGSTSSYTDVTRHTDEEWWNEMRQYMEEHWAELEDNGYYRYGGYGRCGGCRW